MPDINDIDNFINDMSDQASAWYSAVTRTPFTVPAVANTPAAVQPSTSPFTITMPAGSDNWLPMVVLAGGILAVILLLRK